MTGLRRRRLIAVRRWAVAVTVYFIAVFHRTSLGVAGLQAVDRFDITASQLSVFIVMQLGVYAAMQIPTGILVDRYGPRRLLVIAAGTMGCAQLLFAVAGSYPVALFARALLGLGDALTFVSVLRFALGQFSPTRYPFVVSLTGTLGGVGNLVATLPLASVLHRFGWTPTFATAGGASILSGLALLVLLPRTEGFPRTPIRSVRASVASIRRRIHTAWSLPGTRAGFWVHFTSMSTGLMFGALWGVPFMIQSQGMSRDRASSILLVSVAVPILVGPIIGWLTGRFRPARIPVAMVTIGLILMGWYFALARFDDAMPRWLLVTIVLVTSVGGPVSAIGFALARDYNGPTVVGTATGIVNVGGFVAVTIQSLIVGAVLDRMGATDLRAYRVAFAAALLVIVAGLVQVIHWWLKARQYALRAVAAGHDIPVPITQHRWDLPA